MNGQGSKPENRPTASELIAAEDAGWNELHELMDSLAPEEAEKPGYYVEGWSAKDLLAHVGSWLAAAGAFLIRIRVGTYTLEGLDIDALNQIFLAIMKDVPLQTVRSQASAARSRMLLAWGELPELTPEATFWIQKAGAEHYAQHLPRLREWVTQLRSLT